MSDPMAVEETTLKLKRWKMPLPQGETLTLAGFSRAGNATFFYVPELKIQLDMGGFSREYQATSFFVTHSHLDHAMYLPDVQPAFAEGRAESRLYVPRRMESYARSYLHSAQELNNITEIKPEDEKPYTLIGVSHGDVYELNKTFRVKVVRCFHTVDTVGYCFYEARQKLKREYEGQNIAELKKKGIQVSEEVHVPKFVFLGDTTSRVFSECPEILTYPVVIVECTHLYPEHEEAAEPSGHMHYHSIEKVAKEYPNTTFVLTHWSLRYKVEDVAQFFEKLGERRLKNVYPWISSVK